MPDYLKYYDLESYLFNTVNGCFKKQGYLSAFDFFCIIIWKANRAKSYIAAKLIDKGYQELDSAVKALTTELAQNITDKDRMSILFNDWKFPLPTASAILTVLYPDKFTVYDNRVCDVLELFNNLKNITNFENLWKGYEDFRQKVKESAPKDLPLRDKDRYLWGKSFHDQLENDVKEVFPKKPQGF